MAGFGATGQFATGEVDLGGVTRVAFSAALIALIAAAMSADAGATVGYGSGALALGSTLSVDTGVNAGFSAPALIFNSSLLASGGAFEAWSTTPFTLTPAAFSADAGASVQMTNDFMLRHFPAIGEAATGQLAKTTTVSVPLQLLLQSPLSASAGVDVLLSTQVWTLAAKDFQPVTRLRKPWIQVTES